jgi:DNA-binding IclR family transcriptional regulator
MPASSRTAPRRPQSYSAPALEKGLDIIELLASMQRPMATREIADQLNRSKSEIFRMVFVLVARGYLRRDETSDELTLTNRLFEIGIRTPRTRTLVEVAVPAMEWLCDACGQSAHLVVVNNGETVVIASTAGRSDINFSLRLGYRRPALASTSGQVIIAFQDGPRRAKLIEECNAALPSRASTAALLKRLDAIVRQGYLIAESHDTLGITDIGAPILGRQNHALASITVPYLNRRGAASRHEQMVRLLQETCQSISNELV